MTPLWNRESSAGRVPDTEGRKKWNSRRGEVIIVLTPRPFVRRIVATQILLGMHTGTFRETPAAVIIPTAPGKGPELRTREKQRVAIEDKRCLVPLTLSLAIPVGLLLKARFQGILLENKICLVPEFLTSILEADKTLD